MMLLHLNLSYILIHQKVLIRIDSKSLTPEWIVISNALGQSVLGSMLQREQNGWIFPGFGKGIYLVTIQSDPCRQENISTIICYFDAFNAAEPIEN